jgi:intergrase/recombinase
MTMTSTTLSTYTSYLVVNRDMKSSLERVANQGTVTADTKYYEENIGKVNSVDEFLDDYRLYSFAMKSYGLGDMTYAKAYMRKVLESDVTDATSFASRLTDKRYAEFAAAFNFGTTEKTAQTSVQQDTLVKAYEDSFTNEEASIKSEISYYNSAIGSITSVDQLLSNSRLKTYVLDSFGLDPTYTSSSYLKQVLTSDPSDPASFVSQTGNETFIALAKSFNFNSDGTVDGSAAQTTDQKTALQLDYIYNKSTFPSDLLADANKTYWDTQIATITNVDDLVNDDRMVSYLSTAFDINVQFSSTIKSILTNDTSAEILGKTAVKALFNFQSDGTLLSGTSAQTAAQTTVTDEAYAEKFQTDQQTTVDTAVSNYKTRLTTVKSLDDFLTSNTKDDDKNNDEVTEVWDVALRAYGIDPDAVSMSKLRQILSSDASDPKSYVNQLKDERFVSLNKAFNFDDKGAVEAPVLAQSQNVTDDYAKDYKAQKVKLLTGKDKTAASTAADTEIEYFRTQMQTITSADQLLADKRLVSFVLESKGIDPKSVKSEDLKKMFASDLQDPNSFVNTQASSAYAEIVASFNFDSAGKISAEPLGTVQQRGDVLATVNSYIQQTLEEQQGEDNEGVRMALYFEREAPDLTSAYSILSDTALFQFFKTTFSMSDYISNMDTDQQASMIKKYIDFDKLQEPDYVQKLIKRFTALYDQANSTTTSPSLSILQSTSTTRISADTLMAVAQLSSK